MKYTTIEVWWDAEGDYLWVNLAEGDGDMVPTKDGKSTVKVDDEGNILGFQILGVSKRAKQKPFNFSLESRPKPDETLLLLKETGN